MDSVRDVDEAEDGKDAAPTTEDLKELYRSQFSKRRKKYFEPGSSCACPNTPCKRKRHIEPAARGLSDAESSSSEDASVQKFSSPAVHPSLSVNQSIHSQSDDMVHCSEPIQQDSMNYSSSSLDSDSDGVSSFRSGSNFSFASDGKDLSSSQDSCAPAYTFPVEHIVPNFDSDSTVTVHYSKNSEAASGQCIAESSSSEDAAWQSSSSSVIYPLSIIHSIHSDDMEHSSEAVQEDSDNYSLKSSELHETSDSDAASSALSESNISSPLNLRDIQDEEFTENASDNEEPAINRAFKAPALRDWTNGPYTDPIPAEVTASQLDVFYMALGLAKQNNFTNKAFNDSVQLLNNIFETSVLPGSQYCMDTLLMDKRYVRYIFYCKYCSKSFGEIPNYAKIKTKNCGNCETLNEISNLSVAQYFCMFNLNYCLESFLGQTHIRNALLKPSDAVLLHQNGFLSDIYDGSMYKKFTRRFSSSPDHVISLVFCTDGAPLFKSSNQSIWPIMFAINELPAKLRQKNILLGGLWFGTSQPPMDLLLEPLVNHMTSLSLGFQITVKEEVLHMRVFITGCCVDSGARGRVQGVKSHGGYSSCNWCDIHGVYIQRAVRYPLTEDLPNKRSHEEILRLQRRLQHMDNPENYESECSSHDEDGNKGVINVSPLINMPQFDMVNSFCVEPMHLLTLGLTRTFLNKWLEEEGDFNISDYKAEINKRITSLHPPLEFRRMPRQLDERARWKARELENWLLFCSVPVLTGILPEKFLKLWLFLAQAVYLLSQTVISHAHVNVADEMIKHFLFLSQQYYGEACMVFNMHLLNHLAEHVSRWGPLWAASAYCFENYNGFLKKIIRSQNGIPNQVIRALSWKQSLQILEPHASAKARQYVASLSPQRVNGMDVDGCILCGTAVLFSPSDEERWLCEQNGCDVADCEAYKKLIRNDCIFETPMTGKRNNNSVAQLNNKEIVQLRNIIYDRRAEKVFVFVSNIQTVTILNPPPHIKLETLDHLMKTVTFVEEELICLPCTELKVVCFRATLDHGDFVAPLPNVYNIC